MNNLDGLVDESAAPAAPRGVIPVGKYNAAIVESTVDDNSSKNGKVLKLTWQVIEGSYAGSQVWQNINLTNPNAKAQEIGQRELAAIREATGRTHVKASEELHNIPCVLHVKIRPAE